MVRLELVEKKAHAAMATCATWAPTNVLYSCSDDQTILKWDQQAEVTGKCCELDAYVTSIAWMPSVGRGVSDVFAVSACDGSFRLVTGSGRDTGAKVSVATGFKFHMLPTSRTTSNRSSWTYQEVGGVEDNFKKNQLTTTHSHSKRPRAARAATGLASRRTAGRP